MYCLISNNNGWGLSRDVAKLAELLNDLGRKTRFQQWDAAPTQRDMAHVNIHLELVSDRYFRRANTNWLIPNAEWFIRPWAAHWRWFDRVLCKTNHAIPIFESYNFTNVSYLGFTTNDIYNAAIPRKFEFVHVSGNSQFKGTTDILAVWRPNWPKLTIFCNWYKPASLPPNIEYHYGKVPDKVLRQAQNQAVFHLQPSRAEGFGHVIWEGLAVGAVVIGSAIPALADVNVIKVPAVPGQPYNVDRLYDLDRNALVEKIEEVLAYDITTIQAISTAGRAQFLENDIAFRRRLKDVIAT